MLYLKFDKDFERTLWVGCEQLTWYVPVFFLCVHIRKDKYTNSTITPSDAFDERPGCGTAGHLRPAHRARTSEAEAIGWGPWLPGPPVTFFLFFSAFLPSNTENLRVKCLDKKQQLGYLADLRGFLQNLHGYVNCIFLGAPRSLFGQARNQLSIGFWGRLNLRFFNFPTVPLSSSTVQLVNFPTFKD